MDKKTTIYKGLLMLVAFVVSFNINAQERETHTIPLSNPNDAGKLVWNVIDGSINVTGYDGDEVIVTAIRRSKSSSYKNKSKNGMKKIDNNSLSYRVEEVNNTVYIKYNPGKSVIDFEVKVPKNFSVDLKTINKGKILVDNIDGTHEVSNTNGPITMTNLGGSVIADALNRDVIIGFKKIDNNATMMFSSLNGDIDISFPKDLKANVMARSDNGNVYTDFEITMDKSKKNIKTSNKSGVYQVKREKGISGSINGGGAEMTFKTLNGDILIRSNED